MNKPCVCLGHSNPTEGFCACDCGELAQGAKIAAPVVPDFKPSILERAFFPVIGIWNVLVVMVFVLKRVAVFVFGIWAMPTTARKMHPKEDARGDSEIIVAFGLIYPVMVTGIVIVVLVISAAVMTDWNGSREYYQALSSLFFTYVQPFLIPLAITNGLSLLYEIGRTKRKFAKAPQTPSVV